MPGQRRAAAPSLRPQHQVAAGALVEHGRAGGVEPQPPAAALGAGVQLALGRRAAALAQRPVSSGSRARQRAADQRPGARAEGAAGRRSAGRAATAPGDVAGRRRHASVTGRAAAVRRLVEVAARRGPRWRRGWRPARRGPWPGRNRDSGPSRGTSRYAESSAGGELADQPLELDRRPPVDRLLDPEPRPVHVQVAQPSASTRKVLVLNTGTASSSTPCRHAEALQDHRPPVDPERRARRGRPALLDHLDRQRRAAVEVRAQHQRVDGRAQVVEVGDPDARARPRRSAVRERAAPRGCCRAGRRGRWRAGWARRRPCGTGARRASAAATRPA